MNRFINDENIPIFNMKELDHSYQKIAKMNNGFFCKNNNFLSEKLKVHCFYVCIFYAPVLILNSIFNHDFIEINVLFLLMQFSLVIFAINAKYSSYIPAQQNIASNISVAIISIASIVPYLLPLPVIFAIVYYNKAIQNLKKYFYD
jgi:hypothetical protein